MGIHGVSNAAADRCGRTFLDFGVDVALVRHLMRASHRSYTSDNKLLGGTQFALLDGAENASDLLPVKITVQETCCKQAPLGPPFVRTASAWRRDEKRNVERHHRQ